MFSTFDLVYSLSKQKVGAVLENMAIFCFEINKKVVLDVNAANNCLKTLLDWKSQRGEKKFCQ